MTRREGDNICKCRFRQQQNQRWGAEGGMTLCCVKLMPAGLWRCGGGGGGWISKFITDLGNCRRKKREFSRWATHSNMTFNCRCWMPQTASPRLQLFLAALLWSQMHPLWTFNFYLFLFFCWRHAPVSLMILRLRGGGDVNRCFGADASTSQTSISTGAFFRDTRAEESDQYAAPQSTHQSPCGLLLMWAHVLSAAPPNVADLLYRGSGPWALACFTWAAARSRLSLQFGPSS